MLVGYVLAVALLVRFQNKLVVCSMSWIVILTQVVLPLVLLGWVAFYPAAGWLAWALQLTVVSAVLLGIGLVSLWTLPPFWTPYLYGLLLCLIAATNLVRRGFPGPGLWRMPVSQTVMLALGLLLGAIGSYLTWHALQGRKLPDEAVVDIAYPFPPGHYLIASGGSRPLINPHLKTLNQTVERFRPWYGQSKALDIFHITPLGFHKSDWRPTDPEKYKTFGVPVLSPCSGKVALVVDGIRDMPVPKMDRNHMAGNHVAIDCGNFHIILAHFKRGSTVVETGDQVKTGAHLGLMGNSGNSSEPHLHLHAQRGLPETAPLSGEPLWLTIHNEFLVRNDRLHITTE